MLWCHEWKVQVGLNVGWIFENRAIIFTRVSVQLQTNIVPLIDNLWSVMAEAEVQRPRRVLCRPHVKSGESLG